MSLQSSSSPFSSTPIPASPSDGDSSKQEISPDQQAELCSQWLSKLLAENPQILSLRERVLPWTGGYSFANVVHTDTTAVLSHVNRHVILELVYQHLNNIGMHRTAEMLKGESGHDFQMIEQPWDKTDLLLLVSLGVLPREDPWAISPDTHHQFVEESLEEDFFASPYREDPNLIWQELLDPSLNVQYTDPNDKVFTNLKAASLKRLVILLTVSGSDVLVDDDLNKFFLTLHSITSSYHFFEHLLALFDCHLLETETREQKQELLQMQPKLRVSVINLIKKWINCHGLFIGRKTLKSIGQFLRRISDSPKEYKDVFRFVPPILQLLPNLSYGMRHGVLPAPTDKPIIPDAQIIFKPTLKITEPDAMEVARQITLLFHTAFKAVHSREFVVALGDQKVSHQTPTLAEFFDFGNRLTMLTLETVVCAEQSQIASTVQQLLNIAAALHQLGNFDALACILRALKREDLNTRAIWTPSMEAQLDELWAKCGDDPAAEAEYLGRARRVGDDPMDDVSYAVCISKRYDSWEATIPNLKVELHSVRPQNTPSFIGGLINWEKRKGISDKTAVLYRFQNKAYNYSAIPQIQHVVNAGPLLSETAITERISAFHRSLDK